MGSWTVLEAIALAHCALEIRGRDLGDRFATAARALADVMVDPETVARDVDRMTGGRIDRERTALRADPKAVTFHEFTLEPRSPGWYARVVIDI